MYAVKTKKKYEEMYNAALKKVAAFYDSSVPEQPVKSKEGTKNEKTSKR